MSYRRTHLKIALVLFACLGISIGATVLLAAAPGPPLTEETEIAKNLAAMLRAGRTVISQNQDRINDPNIGDKGLDGKTILRQATKLYQENTGVDPLSIDSKSRLGKLIRAQMDSIVEVIDAHQQTINRPGVGFKGFIPAVFARLVNEAFARRAGSNAEIKVTVPPQLIRNRKVQPDEWETEVIRDKLLSVGWPKDQPYAAGTLRNGRPAYRTVVPEYYGRSCLACHGSPKGEIDITGYPKEGAKEGDLGGVISITLFRDQ
jgi:uncharacterized protein DUF3365